MTAGIWDACITELVVWFVYQSRQLKLILDACSTVLDVSLMLEHIMNGIVRSGKGEGNRFIVFKKWAHY